MPDNREEEKLLIVDGHSLGHRAFYALPLLETSAGFYTNAIYGFLTMFYALLEREKPSYCVVVFDTPAATFRHRAFKEYKAQRQRSPAEFREQLPRLKEILEALGIAIMEKDGYEADDLIGTVASQGEKRGVHNLIVTGDADLLQLVSSRTLVYLTRRGISDLKPYRPQTLAEKYGLKPQQIVDFKGLKGDPSDNIPGVPGIGEKTALKLLHKFETLEKILENADAAGGKKLQEKLTDYAHQARLSRELATIKRDVPVELDWEDLRLRPPDYPRLRQLYRDLEFRSFLEKIPAAEGRSGEAFAGSCPLENPEELERYCRQLKEQGVFSILWETEPPSRWRDGTLIAAALAGGAGEGRYILFSNDPERGITGNFFWRSVAPLLADSTLTVYSHDIKIFRNLAAKAGVALEASFFDTFLGAYLLAPTDPVYTVEGLAEKYLCCSLPTVEKDCKRLSARGEALAAAARCLFPLVEKLRQLLKEKELDTLYYRLELPLTAVLGEMERHGVRVDLETLERIEREIQERLASLEIEIYRLAGEKFNINSPRQLAEILFTKLKLPVRRKIKTGYSTDARVLAELALHHQIAEKILHYRQLGKLESTYLTGILPYVDPKTQKIYTTFNQAVTATGRLSSSDPNLQNIPVRLEEGRRIREAFIPSREGWFFLAADYSQIELRILAHISQDPTLIAGFRGEEDIHRRTAAEVFGLAPEAVTPLLRNRAKAINFGIVYGISDYGLAQDIGVSREEARRYIDSYLERYQGVKKYMREIVQQAREKGYVTTLLNRRRYLPEINSANYSRRAFAERTALNTPIQGSAADIIKLAMLEVYLKLKKDGFRTRLLLQVHDELILESPPEEMAPAAKILKECMENAFALSVPLKAELKWGKSWYGLRPYSTENR